MLGKTIDPDVMRAHALALAVRAETHRMRTLLRYLPEHEGERTRYLGWYEPAHYVLEANAQLIARRFPDLAVRHSSRPMPARIGMGRNCGSSPV